MGRYIEAEEDDHEIQRRGADAVCPPCYILAHAYPSWTTSICYKCPSRRLPLGLRMAAYTLDARHLLHIIAHAVHLPVLATF